MFELLTIIAFAWLSFKLLSIILRLAGGIAKIIASVLFIIALPLLVVCLIASGEFLMLIPVGIALLALSIVKLCI